MRSSAPGDLATARCAFDSEQQAGAAVGGSQRRSTGERLAVSKEATGGFPMHRRTRVPAGALAVVVVLAAAVLVPSAQANVRDTDRDGLSNGFERLRSHTNPRKPDTDRDKLRDRYELRASRTSPRLRDTDRDFLTDGFEVRTSKTSPRLQDTDRDGTPDGVELFLRTNPRGRAGLRPDAAAPAACAARNPASRYRDNRGPNGDHGHPGRKLLVHVERGRLKFRVPHRRRCLGVVQLTDVLFGARGRISHLRGARHRRGRQ